MDVVYYTCGRKPCVHRYLRNFMVRVASFDFRTVIRRSTSASSATRIVERFRTECPNVVGPVCRARGRCDANVKVLGACMCPQVENGCITVYRKSSC